MITAFAVSFYILLTLHLFLRPFYHTRSVLKKTNQQQTQNMSLNVTIIELSSLKTSVIFSNQALKIHKVPRTNTDASAETVKQNA